MLKGRSVEGRSVKKRSICCVVSLFAGEQDQIDATTDDLASIDQKLVESEEDLEDPEEFLVMLKEKCSGRNVRTCP